MADATAAEVADSVRQYDQARQLLSGYQIVLDLLVAGHFGLPRPGTWCSSGNDLDLTDREASGLAAGRRRSEVGRPGRGPGQRPDRRFFHWEIEFPEVFFGLLRRRTRRQIMHKDRIKEGTAGFDVMSATRRTSDRKRSSRSRLT